MTNKERYKKCHLALKEQGLCQWCREKTEGGKSVCRQCLDKDKEKRKKLREERKGKGLCHNCSEPTENGKSLCPQCLEKCSQYRKQHREYYANKSKERANNRKKQGLCVVCGKEKSLAGKVVCWKCRTKEQCKEVRQSYEIMIALFNKQKGVCPYSGRKLTLGTDASIDHIVPKARGGTNDIHNLQWVHKDINYAKNDLTHDDFWQLIEDCHKVKVS